MRRFLSTEFAVGTFALLGLLMIIYMSLQVSDRSTVGGIGKSYHAYFETVTGLVRKVPVEAAGIACGYVETTELRDGRAYVTVRLQGRVKVYDNASLSIRDRGVLGDKYVQLNPGTPDRPLLENGGEIPKTYSRSDFEKISNALAETSDTLRELMTSDQPKGALGKIVVNLRDLSGKMVDIVGGNQGRINRIVENLESFSEDLNDITGENKEQIHTVLVALNDVAEAMKDSLGKTGSVTRAAERLDRTLGSLEKIVDKVERGEGSVGKLLNDETTVNNLNNAVEGLNETFGLIRKIQLGVRYRGEYLISDKQMQNLVGITIAPAPDKYLLIELVDAPRGRARVVDTVVSAGGNVVTTTQTVQTSNDLLFTIMLAKRFWDVTFRAGLLRSSGGAGMDYHLLKDRLMLSVEAFDFSRPGNRAHIRAYGTFILYKHLLLTGGVDDVATKVGGRNAFAGAGIQFTDNDLKALIAAMPRL
ncbi:MAG: MlaD family protein [Pseudomonadota bacterium]